MRYLPSVFARLLSTLGESRPGPVISWIVVGSLLAVANGCTGEMTSSDDPPTDAGPGRPDLWEGVPMGDLGGLDPVDAGRGADAGPGVDAAVPMDEDGGTDGGPLPSGDRIFVAMTHGGWTATSCDGGDTWTTQERSSRRSDGEHHPYVGFAGVGYTNGVFVMGLGWGNEGGHLYSSANGMDWMERSRPGGTVDHGAILGNGSRFVAVKGAFGNSAVSTDGTSWSTGGTLPAGSWQVRQGKAFPDGTLVVVTTGPSTQVHVSEGDPDSWSSVELDGNCVNRIQVLGGIAKVGDTLVLGSRETLCTSRNGGSTWEQVRAGEYRGVFEDDTHLYALQGSRILRSADGMEWNQVADVGATLGEGFCLRGECVVVPEGGGGVAYHSSNGTDWSAAGMVPSAGGDILSMTAGFANGDGRCGS